MIRHSDRAENGVVAAAAAARRAPAEVLWFLMRQELEALAATHLHL